MGHDIGLAKKSFFNDIVFESLTWESSALPSSSKAHPFVWSQIEKFYHIQAGISVRGSTGYNDTVSAIDTSFDTGMLKTGIKKNKEEKNIKRELKNFSEMSESEFNKERMQKLK